MRAPALVGALFLSACAAAGPDPEMAAGLLEEALQAAERGEHARAVELCTRALRENPEFPEAYYHRGVSRVKLRLAPAAEIDARVQEERALEDFTRAIQLNPAYGDAYFNRAMVLASRAQYRQAAEDLINAVRFRPQDPEPRLWLGRLYEEKFEDKTVEALEHYEKYVDLGGRDPEVREKVRLWKELKKQAPGAPPAAPAPPRAPSAEDESRARDLHEEFKRHFAEGRKEEALRTITELLGKYGHTRYVEERRRELNALHNALRR
ncbi:MAG TPA: tetratricopeptide repeat protein [Planctomycetota bacterium]|nr:tetratricopeptide repeat protein [Planctomycetota bacterium]